MSKKKEEKLSPNAPNIIYVGKRQKLDKEKLKTVQAAKQVPAFIVDGKIKIKLPRGIEKGIYMPPETVARLISLRPADFKIPSPLKAKNAVKPAVKSQDKSTDSGDK